MSSMAVSDNFIHSKKSAFILVFMFVELKCQTFSYTQNILSYFNSWQQKIS